MLSKSSFFSRIAILALALPVAGFSAAIEINGSCQVGTCTSASLQSTALTLPSSASGSYNVPTFTLGNGDEYSLTGTFFNNFPSSTFLGFFPVVTYVGNSIHGAVPAVAQDTITLDMLQDFKFGTNATDWSGTYNERLPLVLTPPGSQASGQVLYSTLSSTGTLIDGPETVGELGPVFGTGMYNLTGMANINPLTGNYLASDFQFTFVFAGGTATLPGSSISSPAVPEPAEAYSLGLGLVGLLLFGARKIRFGNAK